MQDVPIGILLSGGVDSSLITAIASRNVKEIKTFTISFPGHGIYDESDYARYIANHFETDHIELDAGDIGPEMLIPLARQFDEPVADSSMLPTFLVSKLVRERCTVALGGDGADELFGGYKHYSRLLKVQKLTKYFPLTLGQAISSVISYVMPQGFRGRNWLSVLSTDMKKGVPQIALFFDAKYRQRLLSNFNVHVSPIYAEKIWQGLMPQGASLLDRATRMDFKNYLTEDILVKVDRASMMNSLEIRAPFLSVEMIEFAFSKVPDSLKANSNERKIILKSLAKKLLPTGFDTNRKQGFSIPLTVWLKSGIWREFFSEVLYSQDCIFHNDSIRKLFDGLDSGRLNGERLFSLVMFELWRKEYCINYGERDGYQIN